jgi:hypothetical protein
MEVSKHRGRRVTINLDIRLTVLANGIDLGFRAGRGLLQLLPRLGKASTRADHLKLYGRWSFAWLCPWLMEGPPDCDLREVERHKTFNGCMLIEYQGSDGNTYHEFIGPVGTAWFVTYQ